MAIAFATGVEDVGELLQLGPGDAAAHRDAALVGVVGALGDGGGPHRLDAGRKTERGAAMKAAHQMAVGELIEVEVIDHAGDPHRVGARVEGRYLPNTAAAGLQGLPRARSVATHRGDRADPRDRDSAHQSEPARVSMSCRRLVSSRSASVSASIRAHMMSCASSTVRPSTLT